MDENRFAIEVHTKATEPIKVSDVSRETIRDIMRVVRDRVSKVVTIHAEDGNSYYELRVEEIIYVKVTKLYYS